jgi:hypothetical protein
VPDSILNKALEFLGQPLEENLSGTKKHEFTPPPPTAFVPAAPVPEKGVRRTKKHEKTPKTGEGDLLQANLDLRESFPNLIFEDDQVERVVLWARTRENVALDIETHGTARRKEDYKKQALSFVRGTVRLLQFSDGETTFTLDAALLSAEAVASVLRELPASRSTFTTQSSTCPGSYAPTAWISWRRMSGTPWF